MANHVTGTFEATGQTEEIILRNDGLGNAALSLTFAGVGSVTLEWKVDGTNWRTCTDDAGSDYTYTDDINVNLSLVPGAKYRLNCTDATADVEYFLGMPL